MATYSVSIKFQGQAYYEVEAESEQDAENKAGSLFNQEFDDADITDMFASEE